MPNLSVLAKPPRRALLKIRTLFSVWLPVVLVSAGLLDPRQVGAAPALVELPLFAGTQDRFPAAAAAKDYFVRLPEHVVYRAGSELHLTLHPPSGVADRLCSVTIGVNGQTLVQTNMNGSQAKTADDDSVVLHLPVTEGTLVGGWNRVSLQFLWRSQPGDQFKWVMNRAECFLSLAYERTSPFAELSRFPHTVAEEKLLHPDTDSPFTDAIVPIVSILVPGRSRDAHLRATAIVAARLGQLGYLDEHHCRIEAIEHWKSETDQRDAVLIARRDQLGGIDLPASIVAALATVKVGQGLLAEFIHGPAENAHRLVLVSGADDAGLEKAALTLGSSSALAEALPSPAIIETSPEISNALEAEARPSPKSIRLTDGEPIRLRGLYHSEQSVSNWRLPPGYQLNTGGSLRLQFTHSPSLLPGSSSLEILINGTGVGTVALGPATATAGSARIMLPAGLPGCDPMMFTFRAILAIAEADCAQNTNEQPWLVIAGDSILETTTEPILFDGLNHLQRFLLADRFARRTAYAMPASPSIEQVRGLFGIWFTLGRSLPSSPILWPEVVTYQPGKPLNSVRLKGRSVVLLSPVSHWSAVLPTGTPRPAVLMTSAESGLVSMQGRDQDLAMFDPTLAFAQIMPSPWSVGETLVIAGGWKDYAIPAMNRLLLDPSSPDRLQGNLAAIDALGRIAVYDLRRAEAESFAGRVQRQISPGLTAEESQQHSSAQEAKSVSARRWNRITFFVCGSLLFMLVLGRLGFMWEQAQFHRTSLAHEKAVGGNQ